jgi:hypothetical protein
MMTTRNPRHPRLVVPVVTVVLGSAIALGAWIGTGWGAALAVELVTVIAAGGYYFLGGKDTDVGALFGSRPDERQASIGLRATALTGNVMVLVAIGGVVIATATGSSAWPFFLFCLVGAAAFLIGLVIYRDR